MLRFFQVFVMKMKDGFRRIARATRNEVTEGDLQSDAWIMARNIGERRGHPIDFSDPIDQDLVMRALYVEKVKRADWHMRKAVSIDAENNSDDQPNRWAENIPAAKASDPLIFLLRREAAEQNDAKLKASYTEVAAYLKIFAHFKNDKKAVSTYLCITDATLNRRIASATATFEIQLSLFDGKQRIPTRFLPPPGRSFVHKPTRHLGGVQWAWCFDQ